MDAQKRMVVAFVLILLVLFLYQVMLTRTQRGRVPPSGQRPEVAPKGERVEEVSAARTAPEAPLGEETEETVETDLLRVVVSNVGIKSLQLKEYGGLGGGWIEEVEELRKVWKTDALDELARELVNGYKGLDEKQLHAWLTRIEGLADEIQRDRGDEGERAERAERIGHLPSWLAENHRGWVELIPYGERVLRFDVPGIDLRDTAPRVRREALADGDRVSFIYSLPAGDSLVKEFVFRNGSYEFELRLIGGDFDDFLVSWPGGLAVTEPNRKDDLGYASAVRSLGGQFRKHALLSLKKSENVGLEEKGRVDWAGLRTKYFLACIIPRDPLKTEGFQAKYLPAVPGPALVREEAMFGCMPGRVVEGRVSVAVVTRGRELSVYTGPLDYDMLKSMGIGLERVVDLGWGWISPISRGILGLFKTIHRVIPNYGVVIIIFSCIMMGVFFPLTRRGLRQMQEMQKLQPKMEALRKKLKNEPQKLNMEIMKLYRQHGVNPVGGCLPLIFQMPVFFALFSVLRSTIELRRAGFMLWIDDLSVPDTLFHIPLGQTGDFAVHVLPVLMLVSMLVQQRFTTVDPRQKTMAYMMPIMFVFIFWNFPAGLVLYWLTYNVLSIAQHYLIRRRDIERKGV